MHSSPPSRTPSSYQSLSLPNLSGSAPHAPSSSVYRLSPYRWRTFLNILGPLLVLGFYSFVCFYFLNKPLVNNIIPSTKVDGRLVFYSWFMISIFILDWARSGLANLEAAALMNPRLAPRSGMEFMWHIDSNWENVLWLFRACRNTAHWLISMLRTNPGQQNHVSRPGALWWMLSATTVLLFIAVPLSGLTMEITDAYTYSNTKALILGPQSNNFNSKTDQHRLQSRIRHNWSSGRPTTPSDAAILYAPQGYSNVSTTYYQDQILQNKEPDIQIFAGPSVNEMVVGRAWGLSANLTCRATRTREMKLIDMLGFDEFRIKGQMHMNNWTLITMFNESYYSNKTAFKLVVAVDGAHSGYSPYNNISNHDYFTLDSVHAHRAIGDVTTAIFEAYLWQGNIPSFEGDAVNKLLTDDSGYVTVSAVNSVPVAGFGVHCDVRSAVGSADLDPAHRTFSSFRRGFAQPMYLDSTVYPIQILALRVLRIGDWSYGGPAHKSSKTSWLDAYTALGPRLDAEKVYERHPKTAPILSVDEFTTSVYKLLGETVITVMEPGFLGSSYGDLYGLRHVIYLKPGIVPWQPVLILLSLWTFIVVSASVLMAFTRRWAPSLNAFELFKFGAQYTADVNSLSSTRFQECGQLGALPGMVGTLSGNPQDGEYGFIGLSNRVAPKDGKYVFDRAQAGANQSV